MTSNDSNTRLSQTYLPLVDSSTLRRIPPNRLIAARRLNPRSRALRNSSRGHRFLIARVTALCTHTVLRLRGECDAQGHGTSAEGPRARDSKAYLTAGIVTRMVLVVAVRAMAIAEKAKAVGSFTIAAVPSP